jgi:leucyl aminopeptidase
MATKPRTIKATTKAAKGKTASASEADGGTVKSVEKTKAKKAGPRATSEVMGLPLRTWVSGTMRAKGADARSGKRGFFFAFGRRDSKQVKKLLGPHLNKWQLQALGESEAESAFYQGTNGPVWIVRAPTAPTSPTQAGLEKNGFVRFRDLAGAVVSQLATYRPDKLILEFYDLSVDEERACLLGFELAAYSYAENRPKSPKARKTLPALFVKEGLLSPADIVTASEGALAMNIARHYVNLPGGDLDPASYAESISSLFRTSSSVMVEIWEGEKLVEERMGLLLAVGAAAAEGPRLVHLRYRPKQAAEGARPIALVGKGITFDSGGLDIKPSAGMRLMKKDMGGSAAVVAVMKWAERTELAVPLDAYLSIAENAIGSRAFRPGDVLVSRNGMTVEIGNTDAEGRLVLADALDVAVSQTGADKPEAVINLATLTGAIKVGLGADIAGLFSNSDHLASLLVECGLARGDLMWRMPLFQPYRSQLRSTFADVSNCSDGSFGGAITAALFLEPFVQNVPWAHLDIYAWKDGANGAWSEGGGSGQPVLALADVLTRFAQEASGGTELA